MSAFVHGVASRNLNVAGVTVDVRAADIEDVLAGLSAAAQQMEQHAFADADTDAGARSAAPPPELLQAVEACAGHDSRLDRTSEDAKAQVSLVLRGQAAGALVVRSSEAAHSGTRKVQGATRASRAALAMTLDTDAFLPLDNDAAPDTWSMSDRDGDFTQDAKKHAHRRRDLSFGLQLTDDALLDLAAPQNSVTPQPLVLMPAAASDASAAGSDASATGGSAPEALPAAATQCAHCHSSILQQTHVRAKLRVGLLLDALDSQRRYLILSRLCDECVFSHTEVLTGTKPDGQKTDDDKRVMDLF
jgi:hypothetical protein